MGGGRFTGESKVLIQDLTLKLPNRLEFPGGCGTAAPRLNSRAKYFRCRMRHVIEECVHFEMSVKSGPPQPGPAIMLAAALDKSVESDKNRCIHVRLHMRDVRT